MDILEHNRSAWNHNVESGNEWTLPASSATIEKQERENGISCLRRHALSPHLVPGLNRLDLEMEEQGILEVKHSIPYADITDLPKERLEQMIRIIIH